MPPSAEERVLRAKYVDWCSAQLADRFLALSPEEIYELSARAARRDVPSGRPSSFAEVDLQTYTSLVEQVTEVLWQQMALPAFEEWVELYRRDPGAVEDQLLGFWREQG
jgi:hypothetical protein